MAHPTDQDRELAQELALVARSGVGGPHLREQVIAQALAEAREQGYAAGQAAGYEDGYVDGRTRVPADT